MSKRPALRGASIRLQTGTAQTQDVAKRVRYGQVRAADLPERAHRIVQISTLTCAVYHNMNIAAIILALS
jgi:hypothetical protein